MASLFSPFFKNSVKSERILRFARDGISDTLWCLLERAAQKSQNNGYFCSKIEDRGAIEASQASRSDAIEGREAMLSKIAERCFRGIADDYAPGDEGRSPPRASSSSDCRCPPSLLQLPSRVSNFHLFVS